MHAAVFVAHALHQHRDKPIKAQQGPPRSGLQSRLVTAGSKCPVTPPRKNLSIDFDADVLVGWVLVLGPRQELEFSTILQQRILFEREMQSEPVNGLWLGLLRRTWPEAEALYQRIRPAKDCAAVEAGLVAAGILPAPAA